MSYKTGHRGSPLERVMRRVVRQPEGCWIWTGSKTEGGYGHLDVDHRFRPTHQITYEAMVGPIPDGLEIDHLCRTPSCVRPDHLEPVTHQENVHRALWKSHCIRGHELTAENTALNHRGDRRCLPCQRIRWAAYSPIRAARLRRQREAVA